MRDALGLARTPDFKGFWEVRKRILPLFKESGIGTQRAQLWEEYVSLTREGRRLKDLLDEDVAFAVKQIDCAISALEQEIERYHQKEEEIFLKAGQVQLPGESIVLEKQLSFYLQLQRELNLLSAFAAQINGLRKELIKTEMRIRLKNTFFERLSLLGDRVFPIRRERIAEISTAFQEDVRAFVEDYFSETHFDAERVRRSLFAFREEIKTLQAIAKILTLNTSAFSTTREQLSFCWDRLKGMEKELKKVSAEQKQHSSENRQLVMARIEEVRLLVNENSSSYEEPLKRLDEILRWMRATPLTHQDVKSLKEEIAQVRAPFEERRRIAEEQRAAHEKEQEQRQRQQVETFKEKLAKLATLTMEEATPLLAEYRKELTSLPVHKNERQLIERSMKTLRDQLAEKREESLLQLSDDARTQLEGLQEALAERKRRRAEIKAQIEEYRKILGGSHLDFQKAIEYNELMAQEKERLEKMDEGIREIELKVKELRRS